VTGGGRDRVRLKAYGGLIALEALLTVAIGVLASPHLNRDFFTTTSQILPVLLLAVVIDLRRSLSAREGTSAVFLLLVLSFAAGEVVALAIVANRKQVITSSWWLGIVVASLVALSLLVIVAGLVERDDE
jgi:hypothetical protein